MVDWGDGEYERTAAELEPTAREVVARAAIAPGERVLDVACGTGNAGLIAAAAGARVTGLDAAPRLVEVARQRAAAAGADAEFVVGDALDLPFEDGAFDAVVSVFGVIFAPDPARAIAEIVRVLAPGGRARSPGGAPRSPPPGPRRGRSTGWSASSAAGSSPPAARAGRASPGTI